MYWSGGNLFIFWGLFQFVFSEIYSVHCRGLSQPWEILVDVLFVFDTIVNDSVFVITFSVSLLLMYGNTNDFYKLILYLFSLLILLIISRKLLVDWDLLCTILYHLEIETIQLLPFHFYCFSCFITLISPSSTSLKRNEDNGQFCLIPDLKQDCFVLLSNQDNVGYGIVTQSLYHVEVYFILPSFLGCLS